MSAAQQALRQALWPLGLLYGGVAAVRNWCFDAGLRQSHRLSVPVVSIGNLTVGGTGKTPTAAWLCALARAAGRRPGVLARGYGRAPGQELNDEGMMLQRQLPWLLQEQDPDRVAGGHRLIAKGADYIVLDDGFQHRRLHRDLDVVCLDATLPFSNGQCLPAGDLREFRSGLRRAGIVLLTRAGELSAEALAARVHRLRSLARNPHLAVHATEHAPCDVLPSTVPESGAAAAQPLAWLQGRRAILLSAIARPASFRATCAALGVDIAQEFSRRDHHRFTAAELQEVAELAHHEQAIVLTTAKDDARIGAHPLPRHVLRIDLRFLHGEPLPQEFLL